MATYIVTDGQVSTGVALWDDKMYVSAGGTALDTTVNSKKTYYERSTSVNPQ